MTTIVYQMAPGIRFQVETDVTKAAAGLLLDFSKRSDCSPEKQSMIYHWHFKIRNRWVTRNWGRDVEGL